MLFQRPIFRMFCCTILVIACHCKSTQQKQVEEVMNAISEKMKNPDPEYKKAMDEKKRRETLPDPKKPDSKGMTEIEDGIKFGDEFYSIGLLERNVSAEVYYIEFEKGKFKPLIVPTDQDQNDYLSPKALREKLNARFVINGGYFLDAAKPNVQEGLLVIDGEKLSDLSDNKTLSGVLTIQDDTVNIIEKENFKNDEISTLSYAIQSGPRLVERGGKNGIQEPDLKNTKDKRAMRSAVCITTDGNVMFLITDPKRGGLYLYEMAEFAIRKGCDIALNLDGGPASSASLKKYENSVYDVKIEIPAQKDWIHPNLIVIE